MDDRQLIERAKGVLQQRDLTPECTVGEVSAALLTTRGNVYVGVSISAGCGVGFCAEHSAVATMVTQGESRIEKLVAISSDGKFLPPCGRCRELLFQIDRANLEAEVILGPERTVRLRELLPERWQEAWDSHWERPSG
jgi:cytidine deaminase